MTESFGVVAAGHRMTADAAADVLRDGGSAIDAAIAAIAMACVCEPVLCSPGGGGFAAVRIGATGATSVLDFFPQTPIRRSDHPDGVREVHADFGNATQAFHIGPAASATPGLMPGIRSLHAAGARLPLAELVAGATRAARRGVVVTPFQHHLATVVAAILTASPSAAALYAPAGRPIAAGERFVNPGLADALESAAAGDVGSGDLARACVELQAGRGHLTAADLAAYEVLSRAPIDIDVGGSGVHLNPLPAAGGVLVAHSLDQIESTDPVELARAIGATGDARRAASGELAALSPTTLRRRGTTHVSVIDAERNAVGVTLSNGEGNGEVVDGFGFMLNNVLGEDDVNPAGVDWPTDTRLSSMMCPTIVEAADGGLVVLGSGGSNRIRSAICQVVAHACLGAADLADAVAAPRVHVEGERLEFEDRFDDRSRGRLVAAFPHHRAWPAPNLFFGGVHAVRADGNGRFTGVGDVRRDGVAVVVS